MAALKAAYEQLGLTSVKTLLNSGNVIFEANEKNRARLTKSLEDAVEKEFGFRPVIVVRSAAELKTIVATNPFPRMAKDDPGHLLLMTLAGKPKAGARAALAKVYSGPEEIEIVGTDAYITYPKGIGVSKLTNTLLEKHFGVAGTARNWNTVAKLFAIVESMKS